MYYVHCTLIRRLSDEDVLWLHNYFVLVLWCRDAKETRFRRKNIQSESQRSILVQGD